MPLKKIELPPGINRENTRHTSEGGWYEGDKVRFRRGLAEKIGGWERISPNEYLGVCRTLFTWTTIAEGRKLTAVGTNEKIYVEVGGRYYDITPIDESVALTDPFETTLDSSIVTVTDATRTPNVGDRVIFSGATTVGGLDIDGEYVVQSSTAGSYTIDVGVLATASATGGGSVTADYLLPTGLDIVQPATGWSVSTWSAGVWGTGGAALADLRLWHVSNFGEDLIMCYKGGPLYYWQYSQDLTNRATLVSASPSASEVPLTANMLHVSDSSRFVFCFGCNDVLSTQQDNMLVRWSDQENYAEWYPAVTNQSGSLRLSTGSKIVTAVQARQEILVWSDAALYSMQYVGAPIVWGSQLVGTNISIVSQHCVAYVNGVAFWMGKDKFYTYDGTVKSLPSSLRRYVFDDINTLQYDQVFAGTNEEFNEVWWFYCSSDSTEVNRYVVYNYLENVWYYGNMRRSAWLDSGVNNYPIAATYSNVIVEHENGVDDNETGVTLPIEAFITSAEFDLVDGDKFAFVRRMLPDISFDGSSVESPSVDFTFYPLRNSGSGYKDPASEGSTNVASITRTSVVPIEQYTGQAFIRVRGRQLAMKVSSSEIGVSWRLGIPKLDMRPDGRR